MSCLEMKSRELQALWSRRSLLGCSIERVTGLAVDEGPEFQFGKRQIFFSSGDAKSTIILMDIIALNTICYR